MRTRMWWVELLIALVLASGAAVVVDSADAHLAPHGGDQVSHESARKTAVAIHDVFSNDRRAHRVLRLADCESDLRVYVGRGDGSTEYKGLFQFGWPERRDYGWDWGRRKQARATKRLIRARGFQPWPTCGGASR